ncbi:MAG TPA: phenylalanine--tRNA ligase subunit alpha, partial [Chromatiales bacterium]|nr:phenylalanine--tRNA ligase subunit alpha [Chromatiales bacterium]
MQDLEQLTAEARDAIEKADSLQALDAVRVGYLGKKGSLTALLKGLGKLPPEQRREAGQAINEAKRALAALIEARRGQLEAEAVAARLAAETVDVTLPGRRQSLGALHPVTRTIERITALWAELGFAVA